MTKVNEIDENTLDKVLISLQKSISRVNEQSSSPDSDKPRALIIGDIDFELSLNCNNENDKLIVMNNGGININIKGKINSDIELVRD